VRSYSSNHYDNKSLASATLFSIRKKFSVLGSQMRGPRDAIVVLRHVAQLPFFRFTSASSAFIGIYFRFLIFYWYLLPFPHLLFISVYLLVVSVYLLVVSVYDIDVFAHQHQCIAHNINR
jgi:hypothetical protein